MNEINGPAPSHTEQEAVEKFLEVELLHSLGSYTNARIGSAELFAQQQRVDPDGESWLTRALGRTAELNRMLERERDDPEQPARHPDPERVGEEENSGTSPLLLETNYDFAPIADFYGLGAAALSALRSPDPDGGPVQTGSLELLGTCLFWDHDPTSASKGLNEGFQEALEELEAGSLGRNPFQADARVERRFEVKLLRYQDRLSGAESALQPKVDFSGTWERARAERSAQMLLDTRGDTFLSSSYLIACLVAAHLRLHSVEHLLSKPFEEAMSINENERRDAVKTLLQAESLNTFVYVASRSLPWLFADEQEAGLVVTRCVEGFKKGSRSDDGRASELEPKVFSPLWRARRLALLALHRRAFGHALRDSLERTAHNHTAFNDFRKLQHLIRVQKRSLPEDRDVKLDQLKPKSFLDGMDALAETHIGDLYRADHAHHVALDHFCDAHDRLDQLSTQLRESSGKVSYRLCDSRWRIHLMLSKGKGFYEVGNLKRSAKWLLKSWEAFFDLCWYMDEKDGNATGWKPDDECYAEVDDAIKMLDAIRNDPDFRKFDLERKLQPIVARAEEIARPDNLRPEVHGIAAEILLRLGHVIFVMALGTPRDDSQLRADESTWTPPGLAERDGLAYYCLSQASSLDPCCTLTAADLLKIQYKQDPGAELQVPPGGEPDQHWPFGRDDSDQIIRMIEYLLLRWLVQSESTDGRAADPGVVDRRTARRLIADLLTHTDSINVRQSQVYRYLMQPRRRARGLPEGQHGEEAARPYPSIGGEGTAIEFICLRRYSSFFPFVPRPSAFRSVGGGYLLRLHHKSKASPQPFGIAVDPGPDFIENLYRCGFGLGDINMIIVTHDHSDHFVELFPILSLLGYRMTHGDDTFRTPQRALKDGHPDDGARRMLIVGNESVARQLDFFNKPHPTAPGAGNPEQLRPDALQVVSFDEFDHFRDEMKKRREAQRQPEVSLPDELRLEPIPSIGHRDAFGTLAYGFRLSLGEEGPSIGFTGDTGGFRLTPDGARESGWKVELGDRDRIMDLTGRRNWKEHWERVLSADVLVAHVSGLPLPQLRALAGGAEGVPEDDDGLVAALSKAWDGLSEEVRSQVRFGFWLQKEQGGRPIRPLGPIEPEYKWPASHLYLAGLLEFAREYEKRRSSAGKPGLFLVGELREELGSLRSKIAARIEQNAFGVGKADEPTEAACRALTADVGLRVIITSNHGEPDVRVLCSTCDLDNDRTRRERFHGVPEIHEVCVKGESEGMFYNCSNHDPSMHRDQTFVERVERYDVFSSSGGSRR